MTDRLYLRPLTIRLGCESGGPSFVELTRASDGCLCVEANGRSVGSLHDITQALHDPDVRRLRDACNLYLRAVGAERGEIDDEAER